MHLSLKKFRAFSVWALILCQTGFPVGSIGQQRPKTDATVRVQVNLVQTDVAVFDRQGRFVPGITYDQFELQIDGKRQEVASSELVSTGSGREGSLWAPGTAKAPTADKGVSEAGRDVLFFVDDWHLSVESLGLVRASMEHLIDTTLGVSDRAGIFSASGNLGFLQQLTDNRSVLRAALQRLNFFNPPVKDKAEPPMTEAQALLIEQNDDAVLSYFIDAYVSASGKRPTLGRAFIEKIVRSRASALAAQSVEIAQRTFVSLGGIMRTFAALPGRKVIFFLSDGFVLQAQRPEIINRIRELTTAAARAGIVIYSLDTRGLIVGGPDAANPVRPDTSSRLTRAAVSEVLASRDALNALAADTGGVFLKDTNALDTAMAKVLEDTSRYYLLGWYLDRESGEPGKYKSIRVTVKGRPDLRVRVRQGKVDLTLLAAQGPNRTLNANPAQTDSAGALLQLLRSPFPIGVEPVSLYVGYDLQADRGLCLSIGLQTSINAESGPAAKSGEEARIEMVGLVSNKDGETVASFADSLIPTDEAPSRPQQETLEWMYTGTVPVKPGIYQVRVAVRDARTGRSGSALEWVDVPEFSPERFNLGSIALQEAAASGTDLAAVGSNVAKEAPFSIKRLFAKSARVSYSMRVFNPGGASLQAQVRVYQGNRLVRASTWDSLAAQDPADIGRLSVHGPLVLQDLEPGTCSLEILVRSSETSAPLSQSIHFRIQ